MNHYYVDTRNTNYGDGSKSNPFKKLSSFLKSAVAQPFTLHLIGGQYEMINETIYPWSQFINNSAQQSFILVDDKRNGDFFDLINTADTTHIGGKINQTTIKDIQFKHVSAVCNSGKVDITLEAKDTNKIANVWLEDCRFITAPWSKSTQKVFAVSMKAWDSDLQEAHKFGAKRCITYNCTAGINAMGNAATLSDTSNVGDNKRGKGVVIEDCGFINCSADGAILNGCASNLDPLIGVDEWTSRISRCYYNMGNQCFLKDVWTAALWFYSCNKCLIEESEVVGSVGSIRDKQAFDFDEYCWNNLIKNCYSVGNCGGFVLTSSWGKPKPSDFTGSDYDWFFTRRFGGGYNTVENCISYNDGYERGIVQLQGFVYGMKFKNNTVIRTQSSGNYNLFGGASYIRGAFDNQNNLLNVIDIDKCLFLTSNMNLGLDIRWAGGEGQGQDPTKTVKIQNSIFTGVYNSGSFGQANLINNQYNINFGIFNGSAPSKKQYILDLTKHIGIGAT